jgi:hypothetical protein
MNKNNVFKWLAAALLLAFAIIQFIPSEPVHAPGDSLPEELPMSPEGSS